MRIAVPIVFVLVGCVDRRVEQVSPSEPGEVIKTIPVDADLDLLFVIDNSASTGDKQTLFQQNFGNFIAALDQFPSGRPSLHIAVVDTTVDIGASGFGGCPSPDPADNGLFQIGNNCGVTGRFLVDEPNPTGRTTNYTGTLASTFTCMASVGDRGCGFEAPLEAMKRALDGSRPENAGFRRAGAPLAIVILTDEDDASVADSSVFALPGSADDFRLQPLYAYACDTPISASAPGSYTGCKPRTDSYLRPTSYYSDFLASENAMVAVIASPPPGLDTSDVPAQRANVNTDAIVTGPLTFPNGAKQALALQPSTTCTIEGNPAIGRPALRLAEFAKSFGSARGRFYNVCQSDYAGALQNLDEGLFIDINPCLEGPLSLPLDCTVGDLQNKGTAAQTEELVVPCTAGGLKPCWTATEDARTCPTTITHYKLNIDRDTPPPTGTDTIVSCAVTAQ
jgi:hypothetical protein